MIPQMIYKTLKVIKIVKDTNISDYTKGVQNLKDKKILQ